MSAPPEQMQEVAKNAADYTAVIIAGVAWFEYMPHITALLSIVWFAIRIYESDTVQKLLKRR